MIQKALCGDREKSAYYKCLNGKWDFEYYYSDYEENVKEPKSEGDVPVCRKMQCCDKMWYYRLLLCSKMLFISNCGGSSVNALLYKHFVGLQERDKCETRQRINGGEFIYYADHSCRNGKN